MHIKNKHSIVIISILILVFFVEAFYLWFLPKFFDLNKNTKLIEKIFEEKTNANLVLENLKFNTYADFSFSLSADKFIISTKSDKKLLEADKAFVRVPLFPLLIKDLDIKNIKADSLNLDIQRYKNGKYNLESILFKSEKKIFNIKMKNARFNISKYDVHFKDDLLNKDIKLKGNYFKVSSFTMQKQIDIDTQGTIIAPGVNTEYQVRIYTKLPPVKNLDDSKFVISGFIKDLEPKYFSPYIKKYLKEDTKDISGKASFNFYTKKTSKFDKEVFIEGVIYDLFVKKAKPENNISAKGKNIISTKFRLNKNKIEIIGASLKGNKYGLSCSGKIKDYKSDEPNLDLVAVLDKSRAESIVSLLPSNLIPNREEIRKVKRYGLKGDIEAKLSIKGDIPRPNLIGTVNVTGIHMLKGLDSKHTGVVKLIFDKRRLFTNVKIDLINHQSVVVKGLTHLNRDKVNSFDIVSTNSLDLNLVQKLLLPIRDVFGFQLGPIPNMKLQAGTGAINLHILGTKKSGVVKGFVKFKKAKASYNGITADLYGADGSVDFYGKTITYKTDRAYLKNYPVFIGGNSVIGDVAIVDLGAKSIDSDIILDIVHTSPLLKEISKKLVVITKVSGPTSFKLTLKAKIDNIDPNVPLNMISDMEVKGNLGFNNAVCYLKGFKIPIKKLKGSVDFTNSSTKLSNITGVVESSGVKIFGDIINNVSTNIPSINIFVTGNKIKFNDTIKFLTESDMSKQFNFKSYKLFDIDAVHDLDFSYKAKSSDIDLNAISFVARFLPQKDNPNKSVKINSGRLSMLNGNLKIENLNSKVYNTAVKISGDIKNIYSSKPVYDIDVNARNFDVAALGDPAKVKILPANIRKILAEYTDYSGNANMQLNIHKGKVKGNINLTNVKFNHKLSGVPIVIDSAGFVMDADNIYAKSLNAKFGQSPLYAEFVVSNITKKPMVKGYFTTKITDDFIDNYINSKLSYPVKVKGDIALSADVSGTYDNLRISPIIKLNEGSDISYLSSNIGDDSDIREINGNILITPSRINIERLEYFKYMESQNAKIYPLSLAVLKGSLLKNKNKYVADTLLIKTSNSLPTRLLNFIFKKSILKQGTFNCSLLYKVNPATNIPKILGDIDFKNVDIPLYDTIIKDISLSSNTESIDLDVKGTIFDSDFSISSEIENKLVFPINITKLDILSKKFNCDKLVNTLNKMSIDSYQDKAPKNPVNFDIANILIRNGHILAEDVDFRSLPASKLNANFSLDKSSVLKVNDMDINVAGGSLKGDGSYNFKTTKLEADMIAKSVDSSLMSDAFFDMKNQIYGNMNGQLYFHTNGSNKEERLKNLSGLVYFNIIDGKMPKLGSLEYLLRASNIVKSGITGFTINSIIDIVNPVRTGQFSTINGGFMLDEGVAKNIEIFSKGENLSIYIKGSYDLVNSNADMRVLGKLSKKIPTVLGPLGDTSINSLFSVIPGVVLSETDKVKYLKDILKIPGLDFNNDDYRVFQAEIDGNINGSSYVSSFKWVE